MNPPLVYIGAAISTMAREFGWRQMLVITEDEDLFTMVKAFKYRV